MIHLCFEIQILSLWCSSSSLSACQASRVGPEEVAIEGVCHPDVPVRKEVCC